MTPANDWRFPWYMNSQAPATASQISSFSPTFAFPLWHLISQQKERWCFPKPPYSLKSWLLHVLLKTGGESSVFQNESCTYQSQRQQLGSRPLQRWSWCISWKRKSCFWLKWRQNNSGSWRGFWKLERLGFQGLSNKAERTSVNEKQRGEQLQVSLKMESGELLYRLNHGGGVKGRKAWLWKPCGVVREIKVVKIKPQPLAQPQKPAWICNTCGTTK